jgi:hypothetical protein
MIETIIDPEGLKPLTLSIRSVLSLVVPSLAHARRRADRPFLLPPGWNPRTHHPPTCVYFHVSG